ncbi:MAG: hypothetical protein ACK512_05800, partial [Cyanobium sp.]
MTRPFASAALRLPGSPRPVSSPSLSRRASACWAAALVLLLPATPILTGGAAHAQAQEDIKSLAATGTAFDINAVKTLVARGDAA